MALKFSKKLVVSSAFLASLLSSAAHAQDNTDLVLGVVLPLTGILAPYGQPNLKAIELAVDNVNAQGGINGKKLRIEAEDSEASNTTAVNAMNKLLGSHPVAIIGPGLGTQILALQPLAEKAKVVMVAGGNTRTITQKGMKYFFRDSGHDEMDKELLAHFLVATLKKSRVGITHVAAEWGYSGRDFLTLEIKKEGGLTPVAVSSYQPTDKDMTPQIMSMMSANADVIVTQGYPIDESLMLKKFRQLGGKAIYVGSGSLCKAFLRQLVSKSEAAGAYCVAPDLLPTYNNRPAVQDFVKKYTAKAGYAPDMYVTQDYDAVGMLAAVMRQKGTNSDAIREGMASTSYDGVLGTYKADAEGNLWHHTVIMQFAPDGSVKTVAQR
jgi:branched-chain amino acid transport system substrate-binding protein